VNDIEAMIDAGQLTLADIDHITEVIRPFVPEALTLVFRTRSVPDTLITFITDESRDNTLNAKGLLKDLSSIIKIITNSRQK
jgi:hypothetical protein